VKTFPVKQELIDELEKTYLAVIHHSYRVNRFGEGGRANYNVTLRRMTKAFDNVLIAYFRLYKKDYKDAPKNIGWFLHQLFTICLDVNYTHVSQKDHSKYIDWAETYIHQIHKFLDTREFTEYFTHYWKDKQKKHYVYFEDSNCFEIANEHLDEYIERYEGYVKQYDKPNKWDKKMKASFQKSLDRLRYRKRILNS